MKRPENILLKTLCLVVFATCLPAKASQSSITEADGESCMGKDKSRNQTELAALEDAKRQAVEFSSTYIESTTEIENFELKKDLVTAFAKADVKVLTVVEEVWQSDGDCYTIRIKAEVIPVREVVDRVNAAAGLADDPTAPLQIQVRSDKERYARGESMKVYIRGNKPFFARVLYVDAAGNNVQILPNIYRKDNYFAGGVWHAVPDGRDKFDLLVSEPFGEEKMTVYASSNPLGQLDTVEAGPFLAVNDAPTQIAAKTRGITISSVDNQVVSEGGKVTTTSNRVAEFAEDNITLVTFAP